MTTAGGRACRDVFAKYYKHDKYLILSLSNNLINIPMLTGYGSTHHLYNICTMLDQRQRRWADVLQMYKCMLGTANIN